MLEPSSAVPKQGTDFPVNSLLDVPGGKVVLGKPDDYPSFGFDNEYGTKGIEVGSRLGFVKIKSFKHSLQSYAE